MDVFSMVIWYIAYIVELNCFWNFLKCRFPSHQCYFVPFFSRPVEKWLFIMYATVHTRHTLVCVLKADRQRSFRACQKIIINLLHVFPHHNYMFNETKKKAAFDPLPRFKISVHKNVYGQKCVNDASWSSIVACVHLRMPHTSHTRCI